MPWQKTACILCECNCGLEVELDGRRFVRFRGDKSHPASRGYACEKPQRLDFYQNHRDRITKPLRRRSDGSFEEVGWETAVREVADRLAAVRDRHGGEAIFYYGGGGQGNHLPGAYGSATRRALGSRFRVERSRAGEDRRVLGQLPHARDLYAGRLRALRRRRVHRQKSLAQPLDPPRPDHAEGDRPRSGAHDDRDRPATQRNRGAGRHPPAGPAGYGRLGSWPRSAPSSSSATSSITVSSGATRTAPTPSSTLSGGFPSQNTVSAPASTRLWSERPRRPSAAASESRRSKISASR